MKKSKSLSLSERQIINVSNNQISKYNKKKFSIYFIYMNV